jgi:hypothetical protein
MEFCGMIQEKCPAITFLCTSAGDDAGDIDGVDEVIL